MKKYICTICGAEINENNIHFNEAALNIKDDALVKCPFCGVGIEFLSDKRSDIKKVNEELDEATLKVLDHALKLEIFNSNFYRRAAEAAKLEENKTLFLALSNIEMGHAKVHYKLGKFKEMPKLVNVSYDKYNTDKALLQLARQKEEHAVRFYNSNKEKVTNKEIAKIFEALCNVEEEHIYLTTK